MKKALACFLSVFLMFSITLSLAKSDELPEYISPSIYDIWGIPWGLSPEGFVEEAYRKTEIQFVLEVEKDGTVVCNAINPHEIFIEGYPLVSLKAWCFSNETSISSILVNYGSFRNPSPVVFLELTNALYTALLAQYEPSATPCMGIGGHDDDSTRFYIPMKDGQLNQEVLQDICRSYDVVFFSAEFGNYNLFALTSYNNSSQTFNSNVTVTIWDSHNRSIPSYGPNEGDYLEYIQYNPTLAPRSATPAPAPTFTPVPTAPPRISLGI